MAVRSRPEGLFVTDLNELDALPMLGRVLVASRLARRLALATPPGIDREAALRTLDTVDEVIRYGTPAREARVDGGARALHQLGHCLDAWQLGEAGSDAVTGLVGGLVHAVCRDPRTSALQVSLLAAVDAEQIGALCREQGLRETEPLTGYVFERLAPVHALTLIEPRRTPEEEAR